MLGFTHVVACINISFFKKLTVLHCKIIYNSFIHSPLDGRLGIYVAANVGKAAVNI